MDGENPVNVIRHDDKGIQSNLRKVRGDFNPAAMSNFSKMIEVHARAVHASEKAAFLECANCHKILTEPRVVEAGETNRATIREWRGIGHGAVVPRMLANGYLQYTANGIEARRKRGRARRGALPRLPDNSEEEEKTGTACRAPTRKKRFDWTE